MKHKLIIYAFFRTIQLCMSIILKSLLLSGSWEDSPAGLRWKTRIIFTRGLLNLKVLRPCGRIDLAAAQPAGMNAGKNKRSREKYCGLFTSVKESS